MPHTAYVNIGSNTGDRAGNISRAVACLADAFPGAEITGSDTVESDPWGFESPNRFLNKGLAIAFAEQPEPQALLARLLAVERELCPGAHRNPDGSYRDRAVDIDLIAIDDLVADTPQLQLPHPRMHLREFVLRPMIQLAPGWRHPVSKLDCRTMLDILAQN